MVRSSAADPTVAVVLLALSAACTSGPPADLPIDDRYAECASAAGQQARREAARALVDGDAAAAVAALRRALAACPEHLPTHVLYIETATQAGGELAGEMRRFYAGMADDGTSPLVPYLRAKLEPVEVTRLELLQQALERDPQFHAAHAARGDIYGGLGKPDVAIEAYEAALAIQPASHDARKALAEQLFELGRFGQAERHYATYLRARPADLDAVRRTAHLRIFELERAADASELVAQLLANDPQEVEALMDQAAIEWFSGRHQAAAAGYRKVLELDWTEARAALSLGNLHYEVFTGGSAEERAESLRRARLAYLYFLRLERLRGPYDYWDQYLGVPHRVMRIDEALGPLDGETKPRVGDF